MDREKAIQILTRCEAEAYCSHYKKHFCCVGCGQRKALDLAIEALRQTESGDCVSRGIVLSLIRCWGEVYTNDKIMEMIESLPPSVEPKRPEIIRCKNCRHDNNCEIQHAAQAGSGFFCGAAERRGEK